MNVQVILSEEVTNLGRPGDVVKVRAGYARNYLLPRKLAVEANPKNLREFEHAKGVAMLKREALKQKATGLKARIEALTLAINARAGEEGKLFGSVTSADIAEQLTAQGFTIERRLIDLHEPIRALGVYRVPVRLHADVKPEIRVWVIKQ